MLRTIFQILIIFVIVQSKCIGQVYKATAGNIHFFSKAPLEDIEANSKTASSVLNTSTKEVAVLIKIKSFQFDKKLMQEHFNENYLESEKYPNATFQGKIQEDLKIETGGSQKINVQGDLLIHGVKKPYTIPVTLTYGDNNIKGEGKFFVKLEEHNIKIPTIVFNNIAENIEVTFDFKYIISK